MTRKRSSLWSLAASGLLALVACACSTTPNTSGTTTSTTTSSSSSSGGGSTPSPAMSKADIKKAYMTLFDLANPSIAPKLAVVQDGQALKATMTKELHSALAKKAGGAKVQSIKLRSGSACQTEALPSPCALVTYTIVSPTNKPLLASAKGFAVYVSSKWLVSKSTICTLLQLANGNKPPAGC
jgi:hypothetical protein